MSRWFLAGILLLAGGCAAVPFREAEPVLLETPDPLMVVERFKERIPDSFQLVNSIVFEYNWFTLSGIGYVDIREKEGIYKVACLNHLGVKLFEFSGIRDEIVSRFAIEPLAGRGDVIGLVAKDIRSIYLDRIPFREAKVKRKKHEIVFRQRHGDGAMEYVFAGTDGNLVRKTYKEDNRAVWRVFYYEYQEKGGKIYPAGIVFKNYRYGYRLIVKQKEIRD